jgi:CubicO group peptidase (beta-lactamase class C family)
MVNIDTITSVESALKNGLPVYQKPLTSDELLIKYCSDTLVSEPGKVFNYNNAEYIILGKIIEQIERKPYGQVLGERILQPLQMKNSGFLNQHDVVKQLADTYFFRDDLKQLVNDLPVYMENWYAAGAMYATTTDLLTFLNALFGAKLLKKQTLAKMVKPGLEAYDYSVWVGEWEFKGKKYTTIQRPGQIMGAQGKLVHFLDGGSTIIILSNTGTVNMDEFAYQLSKKIME